MFGTLCQRWDSNKPHQHDRKDPSMFPDDASVSDAGNYCRDPYGDGKYYLVITRSMCIFSISIYNIVKMIVLNIFSFIFFPVKSSNNPQHHSSSGSIYLFVFIT
jgi:hypothetical protein